MEDSWEIEVDPEITQVRKWREDQLKKAGVGDFAAFRLAMAFDIDLHKLVGAKEKGASDDFLTDQFLD